MVYFKFEFGWGRNEKKSSSQIDNSSLRGWEFVNSEVKKAKAQGKYKTASNYLTATRSWSKFLKSEEWSFTEMTADNLMSYQHWLGENNVSLNTISAYMRALRVLYHRVMEHEGNLQVVNPFAKVFTGRTRTDKRSITQTDILRLHALSLPPGSSLALARDIFIFSFYAMGMPFVDIAYLRKEQIKDGMIFYDRHKTRQRIHVSLLPPMTDIIHRYELAHSDFVFPILTSDKDTFSHAVSESLTSEQLHHIYLRRLRQYNYSLRRLSEMLGSHIHLSSYVVRHSWASIAYQHHFDIGLIGRALGHTKQSTTLLYIKSLETSDLGTANHTLMEELGL